MKVLFIGDIVGRSGRDIVFAHLAALKKKYAIDLTIANGENSAHGKGITFKIYEQLIAAGIDLITLGNHAFSKCEIKEYLSACPKLIQPYNHLSMLHQGYKVTEVNGCRVCVTNILGSAFMYENRLDAFSSMKEILNKVQADLYLVDLHAEATSEKNLFAYYFKDRVQAILGTHTHIQTADERIIGKAAFISDVGMCGAYDSIIGRDIDEMIAGALEGVKTHYTPAVGPALFSAVVLTIDEKKKRAEAIERLQIRPER